ncbi:MAG: GyrI-like domain-containing protein [Mariprofundaceae bacterium]|nr:GyrI-like domain-containing protein [Mariprofundaceae bacterium]
MSQKLDLSPSNSFVIAIIASLLMTVLGGAVAMWYLGVFSQVEVKRDISEPYRIAYILNTGPRDTIYKTLEKVAGHLRQAGIEPESPCILLLDGSSVHESERRSKVGYLISADTYLPPALESETLPEREVLIATFRGGAMIGSYRGYQAMGEWAGKHGYTLSLPAFEIYHPDGTMEYQLGVSGASER